MHHAIPLITTIVGGLMFVLILSMIANKLRTSPLVRYLLAGVLAGPFTPSFVADTKPAPELAELGVILLMLDVGLHFSLKDLMAVKSIAIPSATAQIVVATLLSTALSAVLSWSLMVGIVFGLCLLTTSAVVLLHALEERQLIDSQRGQIVIGWLIAEDLVTVLTLVLLPTITEMLEKEDAGSTSLAVDIGITIGKVATFIAIVMLVGRHLVSWIVARSAATGLREPFALSVLALALGTAFGAVELFDVPFALGTFFAGMMLNESELSHRATYDILPLRDAFAVLLFVSVGMLSDPLVLIQQPLAVLGTLAIITFSKSLTAYFLVRLFGHFQRTVLIIATSLAQIGGFAFIPVGLGMALNLLPQVGQNLVLAEAILSIMSNSALFAVLERYPAKIETLEEQTLGEAIEEEKQIPVNICSHTLLVGFGRTGSPLGEKLTAVGAPLVMIETSRTRVDELREREIRAVLGNTANEEIMNLTHLDCARWPLLTIPDGYEAGEIAVSAREKCPSIEIIVRAYHDDEVEHITERGANQAIMGEHEITRTVLELIEMPPAGEVATAS